MEENYQITLNGQAPTLDELNVAFADAALADDRTLATLHALSSTGLDRGVLQSGYAGSMGNHGIVQPGHSAGCVDIAPFRAFIHDPATPIDEYRGALSGLFCAPTPTPPTVSTDPMVEFQIPAGSATPRWDLLCARVEFGADSVATDVKRKDPTTGQVTTVHATLTTINEVTIHRVEGTTGGPPAPLPAAPADSGSFYYVPLAYVRIKSGYAPATDSFTADDIWPCSYVLDLHSMATGAPVMKPASGVSAPGGALFTHVWYTPGASRPQAFLPTTMQGGESRIVPLNFGSTGESATFASGDIVDSSIDWRNRFVRWQAFAGASTAKLASATGATTPVTPSAGTLGTDAAVGAGQSFVTDTGVKCYVARLSPTNLSTMAGSSSIDLYVDSTDGALKIDVGATSPACQLFLWLDATAPYDN